MQIRPIEDRDLDQVLELNQASRPALGDLDMERLRGLVALCAFALVAEEEERVAGFVLALEPGQPYDSLNYRWLEQRFDDHVYVDRIAVGTTGRGLGAALYEELARLVGNRRISCEVNLRPSNEGSVRFHEREGFVEVGQQETEGGKKRVSLMARPPPGHLLGGP